MCRDLSIRIAPREVRANRHSESGKGPELTCTAPTHTVSDPDKNANVLYMTGVKERVASNPAIHL